MVPSVARQLRLRARGVELGAAAGVEPDLREIERRLLVHDVAARDVELLLLAAQFEVGARDFGRDDHLHVAAVRLRSAPRSALLASSPRRTPPKKSSSQNASKPAS